MGDEHETSWTVKEALTAWKKVHARDGDLVIVRAPRDFDTKELPRTQRMINGLARKHGISFILMPHGWEPFAIAHKDMEDAPDTLAAD